MRFYLTSLPLLIFLFGGVTFSPAQTSTPAQKSSPTTHGGPTTDEPSKPQLREELNKPESVLVYSSILSEIFYHGGLDSFGDNWLIYRKQTVFPKYIDKIVGTRGISDDLIREIKRVNGKPESLLDDMGEKLVAKTISNKDELEILYVKAKKKYPKAKAVLSFSKIALSQDRTQGLVFVEYYSERRKLIGMYFLVPLIPAPRSNGSINRFSVSNEKSRTIPVFDSKLAGQ